MSFEFQSFLLSDVVNIIGGGTPKRSIDEYWNGDIPWLSVVDFNDGSRFVSSSIETITKLGLDKSSTKLLEAGQLIISARGTVGCLAQLTRPMAFNQSCYGLDSKTDFLINDYLYYLMVSKVNELKQKTHGAVFDTITRDTFSQVRVNLPSLNIQKRIAKVLGDLDKKIETNRQINQTLEAMAQAMFKSWFVDFEPVKAKMQALENGGTEDDANLAAMQAISGKTADQLATLKTQHPDQFQQLHHTASLFPTAMQTTELGEIPDGWEVLPLSEIIVITGGGTPKRSEPDFWNGEINWFSVKDAPMDGNVFVIDTEEKITELGVTKSSTKILPVGTTIISARGTVGKLALVGVETAMNQSCYGISGKDSIGSFQNYLNMKHMVSELQRNTHGAVFDTITTKTFETVHITKASEAINQNFERTVRPLFNQIKNNLHQSKSLTEIRDNLLPKLLSGELQILNGDILSGEDTVSRKPTGTEAPLKADIVIESVSDLANLFAQEHIILSRRKTQFSESSFAKKDMLCFFEKAIVDTKKNTIAYHRFSLEVAKENLKKLFTAKNLTIGTVSTVVGDRIGDAEAIYDFFSNPEAQISAGLISLVIGTSYAIKRLFSKEEVSAHAVAVMTSLSRHDGTLSQSRLFQISNEILKGLKISEMDFSEFNTVMKLLKDKCGLVKVTADRNWYLPETVEFKD